MDMRNEHVCFERTRAAAIESCFYNDSSISVPTAKVTMQTNSVLEAAEPSILYRSVLEI